MKKTGRRIWYGFAMFLSGLVMLLCVAGIVGLWIMEQSLADTTVQVIDAMNDVSTTIRQMTGIADNRLDDLQEVTTSISDASTQLGENFTDKGLILLLLPDEKEQTLLEKTESITETFSSLRASLSAGVTLYRSINLIPFVDLPAPSQEQVDQVEASVE